MVSGKGTGTGLVVKQAFGLIAPVGDGGSGIFGAVSIDLLWREVEKGQQKMVRAVSIIKQTPCLPLYMCNLTGHEIYNLD